MNIKQNPFGLYDFLGYFIPGAICIYSIVFINDFLTNGQIDVERIKSFIDFKTAAFYLPFILASYLLGHFLSYISSISIEKYSIWKYSFPSKYLLKIPHDGFWGAKKRKTQKIWRILIVIFIFPVYLFDITVANIFKLKRIYTKELDELLIRLIINKKRALISRMGENIELFEDIQKIDFFRIILHYAFEHSKQHQAKLQNYVALYGFSRTICLIQIIMTWVMFICMCYKNEFQNWNYILSICILAFSAYIFFMSFMKFYRRYTLEGFMILLILDQNPLSPQPFVPAEG